MTAVYEIQFEPAGNTWIATVPAFAEVVTFGTTQEEALRQARKAIEEAIAARIADGGAIPSPLTEAPDTGHFVEVPFSQVNNRPAPGPGDRGGMRMPWHRVVPLGRWANLALIAATVAILAGVVALFAWPDARAASCDHVFTDFMTSTDPVVVNRNGWLLYEMNCDVGRRYRELAG